MALDTRTEIADDTMPPPVYLAVNSMRVAGALPSPSSIFSQPTDPSARDN